MFAQIWPAVLVLAMPAGMLAVTTPPKPLPSTTIEQRERQALRTLSRESQFVGVPRVSWQVSSQIESQSGLHPSCEDAQPPEPLTTPDPLFTPSNQGRRVKVSFIIGTDGRVHSPLILESAGLAGDRHVLQTVHTWRYRPATCNGVPTETEGKIEFSSQ